MDTRPCWILWVGALLKEINLPEVSDAVSGLIRQITAGESVEMGAVKIQPFGINGRIVGLGIQVSVLEWVEEFGIKNEFHCQVAQWGTRSATEKLQKVFKDLNWQQKVKVYHHIDFNEQSA